MSTSPLQDSYWKHNAGVVLVALLTAVIVYLSYDPVPAGSNPEEANWVSADLSTFSPAEIAPAADRPNGDETGQLRGREALLKQAQLLEAGLEKMGSVTDYSATFLKQERLNGVLTEPSLIRVKVRQEPFSVYMKWVKGADEGQQVAYVNGENDNRLLVKYGGVRGRMIPILKMNPAGSLAMAEARYPVTEMGVKKLIERILEFRYRELEDCQGVNCRMIEQHTIRQEDCYFFEMEYDAPEFCPKFRKSHIYISRETSLPVCVKNFGWPLDGADSLTGSDLDERTLLECYSYLDINMDDELSTGSFEVVDSNP